MKISVVAVVALFAVAGAQKFCTAKGKQCAGADVKKAKFAPTPRQCMRHCAVDTNCLSAFFDEKKICHFRNKRCSLAELTDGGGGTDYYRLKKGETCPANRPQFVAPKIYSEKFCMAWGKACKTKGHDLYRKPLTKSWPYKKCLQKCLAIWSCGGVDFYNNLCVPKDYQCPDSDLVDEPGTNSFIRLAEGVDECPPNRSPPSDKEPKRPPAAKPGHYVLKLTTACHRHASLRADKDVHLFIYNKDGDKSCKEKLSRWGRLPGCNITSLEFDCPDVLEPYKIAIRTDTGDGIILKELLFEVGGKQFAAYCDEDNTHGGCFIQKQRGQPPFVKSWLLRPPATKHRYEVKLTTDCDKDAGIGIDTILLLYIHGDNGKTCERKMTTGGDIPNCKTTTLEYDCAIAVPSKIVLRAGDRDWVVLTKAEIIVGGKTYPLPCPTDNQYKGCRLGRSEVDRKPTSKTWEL